MKTLLTGGLIWALSLVALAEDLELNEQGYFAKPGLNVTSFADIYPDGHQTGVTVIQHGVRRAANGDLRLEISPGQWSPVPKGVGDARVDVKNQRISQTLAYPDESKNRKGFNPIEYPDLEFTYQVHVEALTGDSFKVSVDLDKPLPEQWIGKVGFNFELFPGELFGASYLMDEQAGHFTTQPNGPIHNHHGEWLGEPLARGRKLVVAPERDMQRMLIEVRKGGELELWDGRTNHNNGWYIVRSTVPQGASKNAIEWVVTPHTVAGWQYQPVVQISQLGYGVKQQKIAVIEQDSRDTKASPATLLRMTSAGAKEVRQATPKPWGSFLRYHYLQFDFSDVTEPGMYQVAYRGVTSSPFKIGPDVYSRHAWQPTLEYYLPVQMCHMRVNEKYRVWHDKCHHDDALMSPVNYNHIDGYISGASTLTDYQPGQPVPGLNKGGWHDAGDYDLRVESQIGTTWLLAMMVEEFDLDYDTTMIDQAKQLVEIHQADGKNDALQQIEHGLLTVLGGYRNLGRLYRGIIVPTVRQYVMLGDAGAQTDNLIYDASLAEGEVKDGRSGVADDRWVFTEENPNRELDVVAGLAAASRVMRSYNPELAQESIDAAEALFAKAFVSADRIGVKAFALAELILTTDKQSYKDKLLAMQGDIVDKIDDTAWAIGRAVPQLNNVAFSKAIEAAVVEQQKNVQAQAAETPYGVPYRPHIWGAGWGIQEFGVKQYFVHKAWPEIASADIYANALNFVLGVHPGQNTESFASGVGSDSALVAYGVNRADWSYIPGGVISGTALIRPDLPELKEWPFFWQQSEYVMGGGATNYMFLVLAVEALETGD
ncbi:glycoside hydrolase family 9 protein [Gilvimarinus sp. SDUM040013]|uniref:Glycoside hydrolase family 9 protein n=1 Tax=Gilvimarinus gilvus TaxID=3058038 RepID=A0ABU4S3A9_9GAMM|nr:glycoside hydrolase family 9 protein [Gilvimarinus sp. SDUM040013]MDO3388093.1 glycoside hydrolase family 9 protein [Gilvimarinus sp. SDUM040013]MDX6851001.1 glycoside hydrolase family 9 protein [Gilvimarinus sp. SDUM040013]